MSLTVLLEVEYDAETEQEARALAERDAGWIFAQNDVLAISADLKISKASPKADVPGQMDVEECIAEAVR